MYNYIYIYLTKLLELSKLKRVKKSDVTSIIFLFQLIHIIFIDSCIKYFFKINFLKKIFSHDYGTNKMIFIPVFFLYIYVLGWYFKKVNNGIINKYESKVNINIRNTIFLVLIFVLPLSISIFISFSN